MKFEGKIVFITGTNRGIGEALVKAALELNIKKVYAAVRDLSLAKDFKDERVVQVQLDITDQAQVLRAAKEASDTQILINNAGTVTPGTILGSSADALLRDILVNYIGTVNMMQAFAPILEKNDHARIVNIASIAAYSNFPFIAGYSASKAALYSATQAARIELLKKNIAVHAVNPGAIDTDMNKGSNMKDMTNPYDVARSILKEVEAEVLDIIPDRIGRGMYEIWKADPAKLEALASQMFHGT